MTQIWISLFFFVFAQIITFTPALAAGELISGKIAEIQPAGGNQYQITLESGDERPTFMIDEKTLIQRFVQAKNLKKGQKIMSGDEEQGVIKGIKGMKGVKGMKSPFGNMSAGALKNLGLPNIPNVPSVPEIPSVPDIPKMPKKSELPQQIPGVGAGGAPAAGGASPAEGTPGPEAGGKGEQARKPQDVPPPIPDDAGGSLSKAAAGMNALSAGTPELPTGVVGTIVALKKSAGGFQVKLQGDDGKAVDMVLKPEDKVLNILSATELRKDMKVGLELIETPSGKSVQRIVVM